MDDFLGMLDSEERREQQIEERKKKIEEIQNKIAEKKPENLLKRYEELLPLNFVDTIERYYHTFIHTETESLHKLSSYKAKHNAKFELLSFETKQDLSSKLTKKCKEINCLRMADDILYSGENDGAVHMYKIENGVELKKFSVPEVDQRVTAIEISSDSNFLLAGYNNGNLILFDTKANNIIYSVKGVQNTKIMALKIIDIAEKKKFDILSSDEDGQMIQITIVLGLIKKKFVTNQIYKDDEPTYGIARFQPYKGEKYTLGAFVNMNKVRVYIFQPNITPFFDVKKPKYIEEEDNVPDISFGWGCLPIKAREVEKKLSDSQRDKNILFAVGWGNIITIYNIVLKGEKFLSNGIVGHFENNSCVVRLGFISTSFIYFFDKNAQLKIMNTAFIDLGEYEKIEDKKYVCNKNALVDEGKTLDPHMMKNNISREKSGTELFCYRNFIFNMKKCIYLCTEKGFHVGKVLSYNECIEDIIKNSNNWFGAMCLGLEIYQGNNTSFPGVPFNDEERKKKLQPYLIEILNKYIDYIFQGSEKNEYISVDGLSNLDSEENRITIKEEKIMECMNVTIEFCIGIKAIDYLLDDVEKTFNGFGKGDLFYKLFEPFIFNDLLNQETISESTLSSLYVSYQSKNELVLLSHLFTHLNIDCLSNIIVKKLIVEGNLFSLLIFLFCNGKCCEDFFLPITKMFQAYTNKIKEDLEQAGRENGTQGGRSPISFTSYAEHFGEKGFKGINEMEVCKEYIGHKLLWYIDMALKGNKYSPSMNAELLRFNTSWKEYKNFIAMIFYWILQNKVFTLLVNFDSYSFFIVLSQFFTEKKIMKIIKNYDFSTIGKDYFENLKEEQENNSYLYKSLQRELLLQAQENQNNENENNPEDQNQTQETPTGNEEEAPKKEGEKKDEVGSNKTPTGLETDKVNKAHNESKFREKNFQSSNLDLNDINSVLLYIIALTESQGDFFASQDLNMFLIKYASKCEDPSTIPDLIQKKILEGYKGCLSFYSENKKNINNNQNDSDEYIDKFGCHSLNKNEKGSKGAYYMEIYKTLRDLLDSKYKFKEEELNDITMKCAHTPFTLIKIKIAELSKNYSECMKIYVSNKDETINLDVFYWLDEKFQTFETQLKKLEDEKDNLINPAGGNNEEENNKENKEKNKVIDEKERLKLIEEKEKEIESINKEKKNIRNSIIEKINDLSKISIFRTNKLVGKYFPNEEKLIIIKNLEESSDLQFQFLNQILYPENEGESNEDEVGGQAAGINTSNKNLISIEKNNNNQNSLNENLNINNINNNTLTQKEKEKEQKEKERKNKKKEEEFGKLFLLQIDLLVKLDKKKEVLEAIKKNIKLYPFYSIRKSLEKCIENEITDAAVFLFKYSGDNRKALELTKISLDKAFADYVSSKVDMQFFMEKLKICINICKDNSEELTRKSINEEEGRRGENKEGEDLWFTLLETIYQFESKCEENKININTEGEKKPEIISMEAEKQKEVLNTLQKCIEDLLKQMCLYVSIQNLMRTVSEKQNRAQYKEFKSILSNMLRSNSSFDRVLKSIMVILKKSILNSEDERKKVTLKGNNFNYKVCDVCHRPFENSRYEIVYCFGCGHQSHDYCYYINPKNNKAECIICHQNEIEKMEEFDEESKKEGKVSDEDLELIKINKHKNSVDKKKGFKFGNKADKLKKITLYDKKYDDKVSMFY